MIEQHLLLGICSNAVMALTVVFHRRKSRTGQRTLAQADDTHAGSSCPRSFSAAADDTYAILSGSSAQESMAHNLQLITTPSAQH